MERLDVKKYHYCVCAISQTVASVLKCSKLLTYYPIHNTRLSVHFNVHKYLFIYTSEKLQSYKNSTVPMYKLNHLNGCELSSVQYMERLNNEPLS